MSLLNSYLILTFFLHCTTLTEVTKVLKKSTKYFWVDKNCLSWVRLRGPVIQANGTLTFEDDLRSGGSLHSEPASGPGSPTVWSLWGNPGVVRRQYESTLPAG